MEASVEIQEAKHKVAEAVEKGLLSLFRIWKEVGLDPQSITKRISCLVNHHLDIQTKMVQEDASLLQTLRTSVYTLRKKITSLSEKLGMEVIPINEDSVDCLLDLEELLGDRFNTLMAERNKTRDRVRILVEDEKTFCGCLGLETTFTEFSEDDIPDQNRILLMVERLDDLKVKRERLRLKFENMRKTVLELLSELEVEPFTEFDISLTSDTPIPLTDQLFADITVRIEELEAQLESNRKEICKLRSAVEILWDCLKVDETTRSEFLQVHNKCSLKTIGAFEEEHAKCKILKLENIEHFVFDLRNTLVCYWEKCYVSQEEREKFTGFTEVILTEELLDLHEAETLKWKTHFEQNKIIYEKFVEREILAKRISELHQIANNSKRYNNRGCSLLKELKERKFVERSWFKLEECITDLVAEYQSKNGHPFLINGNTLEQIRDKMG